MRPHCSFGAKGRAVRRCEVSGCCKTVRIQLQCSRARENDELRNLGYKLYFKTLFDIRDVQRKDAMAVELGKKAAQNHPTEVLCSKSIRYNCKQKTWGTLK